VGCLVVAMVMMMQFLLRLLSPQLMTLRPPLHQQVLLRRLPLIPQPSPSSRIPQPSRQRIGKEERIVAVTMTIAVRIPARTQPRHDWTADIGRYPLPWPRRDDLWFERCQLRVLMLMLDSLLGISMAMLVGLEELVVVVELGLVRVCLGLEDCI
jgi:hypothetical protein